MQYIEDGHVVELTARNVTALLAKLDDSLSSRTLMSGAGDLIVRAAEDVAARGCETATRAAGSEGVVILTREELHCLAVPGAAVVVAGFTVRSVPDAAHYSHRAPGEVYMPELGNAW